MSLLTLSVGIGRYDHVADLLSGDVRCEGLDLRHLELPVEEVFHRFITYASGTSPRSPWPSSAR
jgi:hypothetical protein